MIKVVGLLKRRAGLTTEQFRDYYEQHHRLIGEKYLTGNAIKYVRRYLEARTVSDDAASTYDCLLEVWYPNEAAFAASNERLSQPHVVAEIIADEERLFERDQNQFFTVYECESQMPD